MQNPDYHRLFELFFNKFDKQARFDYGAFYTPKLLAEFVVRFVGKVVADHFDGATIYDDGNTIIDPCCGTGSFLEQIVAHDEGDGAYNLCGFEILPAPYMLANYRMSLVEQHYRKQNLHPSIILANTLSNYLLNDDANARSIEGQELIRAKELSSRPLKLIIGNPPSSDSNRSNVSEEFSQIIDLMEDFRPPVENRRGRQNIQKQINNPFVQFLRWSCEKLLASDNHSVLALIVPLSFLEAESYKYARKYLVEHFSNVWAIAIDTDARTGIRGDSIFMTMQGRAIIVLTRKYGEDNNASEINYADISRERRSEKEAILNGSIEETMRRFITFPISDAMYSFMPSRPFNEQLYAQFWPISTETGAPGVFLNQCSGAKMAPTALLTHVKQPMLKRRSREIASEGVIKAQEWIGGQDKPVVESKILAFQNALNTCTSRQELDSVLAENIRPCSFRPFVNSNALLWGTIFDYQAGIGGGGARVRPEIKAVYDLPDTVGFSLAHAPKDLDESLGQFTSFCWYFPDNDLSRRGNGHIYLNHYIRDVHTNAVINNIHQSLIERYSALTGLDDSECAKKMVFYSYAVFCSQVYLEEFLDIAFKPLIDFINDAISKEMILMEEQKPLGVTQNIGTVYGTVNQQGGGTINSETTVLAGNLDQIAEIEKMIEKILPHLDDIPDIPKDAADDVKDDLESVKEQINAPAPKKKRLQKAIGGIKKFFGDFSPQLAAALAAHAITTTDWNAMIASVEKLISSL